MMTMMIMLTLSAAMTSTVMLKNPVKVSIILVTTTLIMTFYMTWSSANTWFPLIFYLLFMGGILIMFLILSAINPNTKMKKLNLKTFYISMLTLVGLKLNFSKSLTGSTVKLGEIQSMIQSTWILNTLAMVVVSYFVMFTMLVSSEKNSLRASI